MRTIVRRMLPGDAAAASALLDATLPNMRTAQQIDRELLAPHVVWLAAVSKTERQHADDADDAAETASAPAFERRGHATVSINGVGSIWIMHDEAHVTVLAVDPSCRRNGLGAALVDALTDSAEELGAGTLLLEVRSSNHSARAFYERLGLHVIGTRKGYYPSLEGAPREDAIQMQSPPLEDRTWRTTLSRLARGEPEG